MPTRNEIHPKAVQECDYMSRPTTASDLSLASLVSLSYYNLPGVNVQNCSFFTARRKVTLRTTAVWFFYSLDPRSTKFVPPPRPQVN